MKSLFWMIAMAIALKAVGSEEASVPLMPKDFQTDDRGSAEMMPYMDGVMLKNYFPRLNWANKRVATYEMFVVSFGTPLPVPLTIKGLDQLLNAGLSGGQCVVLGLSGKEIKAVALAKDGSWNGFELPRAFTDEARTHEDSLPVVVPSRSSVALMMNDLLCRREGDVWQTVRLPAVPKFYKEFEPAGIGGTQYLDGTRFYAGWDAGEWGGMLAMADVALPAPVWVHVSGKDKAGKEGIPGNDPVHSIVGAGHDELWVGLGLSHMGLAQRGLYRLAPGKPWETFIQGEFNEDKGPLRFPVPSELADVTVDGEGRVFVLASKAGVFAVLPHELRPVLSIDFGPPVNKPAKGAGVFSYPRFSYPRHLRIADNGDIFVSTAYFGIFVFHQREGRWTGKQIMLGK